MTGHVSTDPKHTLLSGSRRAKRAGQDVADSRLTRAAGRLGQAARGVVYIFIGILAIDIAAGGGSSHQANQGGAFATLASSPGGEALLILVAIGLAGYSLWRLSQVFVGTPEDGKKAGPRVKSLVRAVIYASLFATAIKVLVNGSANQDKKSQDWTATLMHNTGGRWLVGAVGVGILIAGGVMAFEGIRQKFRKHLDSERMSQRTEEVVTVLGTVGETARGVAIGIVGILVLDAAVTADPNKSRGLDGALRELAHQSYGPWLLGVIALGLVVFGGYGLALAKYGRV
jgi:hypothetical protein